MLGDEIDAAADGAAARNTGAARRHAIEHRAGALEDLNPLDEIGANGIVRCDSVKAIQPEIAAVIVETANKQGVGAAACRLHDPDGRVVRQDVANGARLLICDQLRRVVGLVERRIHYAAIAEQSEATARRHLSAGIRSRRRTERSGRRRYIWNRLHSARRRRSDTPLRARGGCLRPPTVCRALGFDGASTVTGGKFCANACWPLARPRERAR